MAVGEIRLATVEDAAEIARLSAELGYPATPEEVASRLTALLPLATQCVAVAEGADSLLGWIAAERRLILEYGERAEIVGLVVSEGARRNGVGRALVSAAERWAVSQDLEVISVRSNIARSESHPFYESIGYSLAKTQRYYAKRLPPV